MSNELKNEGKSDWNTLLDVKSADEFDLNKVELIRGETPHDINEKCLNLCKDYLSGNWCRQTADTIEVRRIAGGLSNQMYFCGIKDKSDSEDVPQEVCIRLYGVKHYGGDRLSDVIIGLKVSELSYGTKVYGVFEGGQIHKYYQHRQFKQEEQKDSKLVTQVFQRLAQIHALEVPVPKTGDWLFKLVDSDYHDTFERKPVNEWINEYNCKTLKENDYKRELDWIKSVVEGSGSPKVFCHNDYRSSNLLITEPNNELVVCDFEYSNYGYRGFDFSGLFREWGRDPFEFKTIEGLPLECKFIPMIEIYVEECKRIHGKCFTENPNNSVDHILKEAKIFYLFSLIMTTLMFMKDQDKSEQNPLSKKVCMEFADITFNNYFKVKEIFKKESII